MTIDDFNQQIFEPKTKQILSARTKAIVLALYIQSQGVAPRAKSHRLYNRRLKSPSSRLPSALTRRVSKIQFPNIVAAVVSEKKPPPSVVVSEPFIGQKGTIVGVGLAVEAVLRNFAT